MNIEEMMMNKMDDISDKLDAFIMKSNDDTLERQEKHGLEHSNLWKAVAILQVKSGFWGVIGGLLVLVPSIFIAWITGMFKR